MTKAQLVLENENLVKERKNLSRKIDRMRKGKKVSDKVIEDLRTELSVENTVDKSAADGPDLPDFQQLSHVRKTQVSSISYSLAKHFKTNWFKRAFSGTLRKDFTNWKKSVQSELV